MKDKWLAWGLLLVLCLIWGSSFILIKRGLDAYSPEQVACLRISIAGLVFLPFTFKYARYLNFRNSLAIFAFGFCNAGLPAFLFALAETRVNSSTAGILNSLTPIFTFITGVLFFGVSFQWIKVSGVIIGFFGACLLIFFPNGFAEYFQIQSSTPAQMDWTSDQILYSAILIPATICYGFSGNIIKKYLNKVPGQVISSFSYLFFAPVTLIWLFSGNFLEVVQTSVGLQSLGFISLLAIFGSAIAIVLFSLLVQKSNALFGSYVTYLLPFVSILWGISDHEKIGWVPFLSLFIILGGIMISSMQRKKAETLAAGENVARLLPEENLE